MLPKAVLFTLASALVASAAPTQQPAPLVANNPGDVVYRADFPSGNSQTVVGVIQFYSLNGTTKVHVDVTGLPKNSGIFSYHIHEAAVGASNNCAETGGHLNPFNAPDNCDAQPGDAYCEVGDLSGKHGLINTTCFETFYYDPYLSLDPGSPQFIGGKSINIHLAEKNNERLACATIKASKEPEDLLLLNKETEAREVKKYEDLSGVKIESLNESGESLNVSVASGEDAEEDEAATESSQVEEEEFESSQLSRRDGDFVNEQVENEYEEVIEEEEQSYDNSESLEGDSFPPKKGKKGKKEKEPKEKEPEENEKEKEKEKGDSEDEDQDKFKEKELAELTNEDLEEKKVLSNSSNLTYNASNISGAGEDESGAVNVYLGVGTFVGAGVAVIVSLLF